MEKQEFVKLLFEAYGTWDLSPKQVAQLLNKSPQTLWRMRLKSIGPSYRQTGDAANAPVTYPVNEIVDYLISKDIIQTVA